MPPPFDISLHLSTSTFRVASVLVQPAPWCQLRPLMAPRILPVAASARVVFSPSSWVGGNAGTLHAISLFAPVEELFWQDSSISAANRMPELSGAHCSLIWLNRGSSLKRSITVVASGLKHNVAVQFQWLLFGWVMLQRKPDPSFQPHQHHRDYGSVCQQGGSVGSLAWCEGTENRPLFQNTLLQLCWISKKRRKKSGCVGLVNNGEHFCSIFKWLAWRLVSWWLPLIILGPFLL